MLERCFLRLSTAPSNSWLTRDTLEVWRVHAGMKAASQNFASAARSVLAMWLSSNSRRVQGGSRFRDRLYGWPQGSSDGPEILIEVRCARQLGNFSPLLQLDLAQKD
jgi:hypothetical protein